MSSFGEVCGARWSDGCSLEAPDGLPLAGDTTVGELCSECDGCISHDDCREDFFCGKCDECFSGNISRDTGCGACSTSSPKWKGECMPMQVCTPVFSVDALCSNPRNSGCDSHDVCAEGGACFRHDSCVQNVCEGDDDPNCDKLCGLTPPLGGYCHNMEGCYVTNSISPRGDDTCPYPDDMMPCSDAKHVPVCMQRGFCDLVSLGMCIIENDKVAFSCDCLQRLIASPEGQGWCPQHFKEVFDRKQVWYCSGTRRLTDEFLPISDVFGVNSKRFTHGRS